MKFQQPWVHCHLNICLEIVFRPDQSQYNFNNPNNPMQMLADKWFISLKRPYLLCLSLMLGNCETTEPNYKLMCICSLYILICGYNTWKNVFV